MPSLLTSRRRSVQSALVALIPFVVLWGAYMAYESGFSSYRTFSRAFTQCMGQSVTAWMDETAK